MSDDEVKVDEVVVETVKAVRTTLQLIDEDKADDAAEIINYIKDKSNHIAIRHEVDEDGVESALQVVKSQEIQPYVPPEEPISLKSLLKGVPLQNLNNFLDREYIGIHHAAGGIGSTGTFILASIPDGQNTKTDKAQQQHELVVLKQISVHSPAEVFASNVMRAMRLRSPRFLALTSEQTRALVDEKLRFAKVTSIGPSANLFEPGTISAGVLLMEFEPGVTLADATDDELKLIKRRNILEEIGRCMAVDMVLNCFDRIPLVWDNDGNATNLMFSKDGLSVIDSAYNRVMDPEGAQVRLEKVKACVDEVHSGVLGPHAERVKTFFENASRGRMSLTNEELSQVMSSASCACEELANDYEKIFQEAAEETRRAFTEIVKGNGITTQETLDECLNLDFCVMCAKILNN